MTTPATPPFWRGGRRCESVSLSPFTFEKLLGQQPQYLHGNLLDHLGKFSGQSQHERGLRGSVRLRTDTRTSSCGRRYSELA